LQHAEVRSVVRLRHTLNDELHTGLQAGIAHA
jgi:hypothetical protein